MPLVMSLKERETARDNLRKAIETGDIKLAAKSLEVDRAYLNIDKHGRNALYLRTVKNVSVAAGNRDIRQEDPRSNACECDCVYVISDAWCPPLVYFHRTRVL